MAARTAFIVGCSSLVVILLAVLYQVEYESDLEIMRKGVVLQGNRGKVFAFISDMNNYHKWYPEVGKFDAPDTAPVDIGKHFTETGWIPIFGDVEYNVIVTGYDPPEYFSFTSGSWMLLHIQIALYPYENNPNLTSLTWKLLTNRRSYLFQYTMVPLIKIFYSGRTSQAMWNLKYIFRS